MTEAKRLPDSRGHGQEYMLLSDLSLSCLGALTLTAVGDRILGSHIVIAAILFAVLGCTARRPQTHHFLRLSVLSIPLLLGAAILGASGGFDRVGLVAWIVLIYLPSHGVLGGVLLLLGRKRGGTGGAAARLTPILVGLMVASVGLAIGIWSIAIEPQRLEITRYQIVSPKLEQSYTVVVIADLQAGSLGDYERRALETARDIEADVILWAGDYLQTHDRDLYRQRAEQLAGWIRELDFEPRLGSYAVQGNVDWTDHWTSIFEGQPVRCFTATDSVDVAPDLQLIGLSAAESSRSSRGNALPEVAPAPSDRFQIVLGHHPDFMKYHPGDLLVAGHTHGGQVQLPGYGPLLNPSSVSKTLAAGGLFPRDDRHLLISRGIGVERGAAPPLRFNCRPEIVVVELVPGSGESDR